MEVGEDHFRQCQDMKNIEEVLDIMTGKSVKHADSQDSNCQILQHKT